MIAISGVLRVEIRLRQTILSVALQLAAYAFFFWITVMNWARMDPPEKLIDGWLLVSASAGFLYFIRRCEGIEFYQEYLAIRRNILGWNYVSHYPVSACSDLTWCTTEHEGGKFGLKCKNRWRTIRFAWGVSNEQAREILAQLQKTLPEVAQKMGCNLSDVPRSLITLGLR